MRMMIYCLVLAIVPVAHAKPNKPKSTEPLCSDWLVSQAGKDAATNKIPGNKNITENCCRYVRSKRRRSSDEITDLRAICDQLDTRLH